LRERAQALIDVAHPEDRPELVRRAKDAHILYADQIYLENTGRLYPEDAQSIHEFKGGLTVRFRAIRPSDEEEMRRLFYRFSSEAVYYRYFSPVKAMPHARMQEYVNVDFQSTMAIVGLVGPPGAGRIIAEARYVKAPDAPFADVAFVVDEAYSGRGIATYLFLELIRLARDRGIRGMTADVLANNTSMWKVLEKAPYPLKAHRETDYYHFEIPFHPPAATG
jgi:RimJ/RimL family protein N-acetyltransferase